MKKVIFILITLLLNQQLLSARCIDSLQDKIAYGQLTNRYMRNHYPCNSEDFNQPFENGEYKGFTPLTLALQLNKSFAINLLLDWGVDPNKEDAFGTLPLEFAIDRAWLETLRLLLQRGAKLTPKLCIHLPNRHPVFEYLMRYHCFDQICLNWMLLGAKNHYDIIKLLKKGAYIHFMNQFGTTAIDNAVRRCDSRSVRILYNYGANLSDIKSETIKFINSECCTTRCNLGYEGERRCKKTRTFLQKHGVL